MKLLLNIILVLITFFACYIEEIYLFVLPPQPQEVIPFTVRSQRYFNFDQEKALGGKREIALSQYVPLYTDIPGGDEKAKAEMNALIEKVSTLRDQKLTGGQGLSEYLRTEYGLELPRNLAAGLIKYQDLKSLVAGILTIEESILKSKIVEDPKPFIGKKTIEVLYPEPSGIVTYPVGEIITLEKARLNLQEKGRQLFWQVDKRILDPLLQISMATLLPNLKYDQDENYRRIEEIIRRYPSKIISYEPGDVLVHFRKILSEEDVLLLTAYQEEEKKDLFGKAPWILIVILFIVVLYNVFLSEILWAGWRKRPPSQLLLFLLVITIFLSKACLLFTAFSIFSIPFAFLPLLIILLFDERVSATWTTVVGAALVALLSGRTLEILLFFAFGGVTAVLVSFNIRKRVHILLPSLKVGIINAVILMAFFIDWGSVAGFFLEWQEVKISSPGEIINENLLGYMGWGFIGGFAAGPLALLLLPLLELSWHTASNFKLNRYADLQHPLMKDLLTKTPATYQHTMTVAYLAHTVGQAIGANTLLLRIGAYYHDIGKMADPEIFSENQSGWKNPHDDLDPQESAKLIINHVTHGAKIAVEMNLPEILVGLIFQHHGTQLVEYFYNKAIKTGQGDEVRKEDFRYPGPKPQSVEAAVLMIVDAVEATYRSIEGPTREKIEKMIRLLIVKRVADGQFDECNLSTRYLARIVRVLVDSLEASFHSRVLYPWQDKGKKGK
ncbi:MAG: HDIG domain-containing metalloprotein [Pseudomonadota bacterium]